MRVEILIDHLYSTCNQ